MAPGHPTGPAGAVAVLEARCRRRETRSDAATVCWRLCGEGAPLILLHGGHGSWLHWFKVVEPLAEHATVGCPDLPGFGESGLLAPEAGPIELARAVAAGIDVLFGPESRVSLLGFSFGGVVAGYLARELGRRAAFLGLVGSGGLGSERPDATLRGRSRDMSPAAVAQVHRHNLGTLMIADPARVDELAVHIQDRNTARRPAVTSRTFSRTTLLSEVLPDVGCPVLGIWGDQDATVGPFLDRRVATLTSAVPGARTATVADCGHWVMYEQPRVFVETCLGHMPQRALFAMPGPSGAAAS